jgi:hypothetical protein
MIHLQQNVPFFRRDFIPVVNLLINRRCAHGQVNKR